MKDASKLFASVFLVVVVLALLVQNLDEVIDEGPRFAPASIVLNLVALAVGRVCVPDDRTRGGPVGSEAIERGGFGVLTGRPTGQPVRPDAWAIAARTAGPDQPQCLPIRETSGPGLMKSGLVQPSRSYSARHRSANASKSCIRPDASAAFTFSILICSWLPA